MESVCHGDEGGGNYHRKRNRRRGFDCVDGFSVDTDGDRRRYISLSWNFVSLRSITNERRIRHTRQPKTTGRRRISAGTRRIGWLGHWGRDRWYRRPDSARWPLSLDDLRLAFLRGDGQLHRPTGSRHIETDASDRIRLVGDRLWLDRFFVPDGIRDRLAGCRPVDGQVRHQKRLCLFD